jgi:hypothetical protein
VFAHRLLVVVVVILVILVTRGGCGRSSGWACLRCELDDAQPVLLLLPLVGPLGLLLLEFSPAGALRERGATRGLSL